MVLSLAEARERLHELIHRAQNEGPQTIEIEGQTAIAVIALPDLVRLQQRKPTLKELLLGLPSLEDVDLARDQRPARDIEL
jgi:hypothetical protein